MKNKKEYTTSKEDFDQYEEFDNRMYEIKTKIQLCVEDSLKEFLEIQELKGGSYDVDNFDIDKISISKNFVYIEQYDQDLTCLEIPAEFLYNINYREVYKNEVLEDIKKQKAAIEKKNKLKDKKNKEKELLKRRQLFLELKKEFEPVLK